MSSKLGSSSIQTGTYEEIDHGRRFNTVLKSSFNALENGKISNKIRLWSGFRVVQDFVIVTPFEVWFHLFWIRVAFSFDFCIFM